MLWRLITSLILITTLQDTYSYNKEGVFSVGDYSGEEKLLRK